MTSGLTDDEVVSYRFDGLGLGEEGLRCHACGVALDFVNGFEHVLDPKSPLSRRHG